jgi:hypothetical protein
MNTEHRGQVSKVGKAGWGMLIAVSLLLLLHGVFWGLDGPSIALENIAGRTSLPASEFMRGSPSAYDVIALTARNFAIVEVALGLMALILSLAGFRKGSNLALTAASALVVALIAMAINFVAVGGLAGGSIGYVGIAILALLGLLLARARYHFYSSLFAFS